MIDSRICHQAKQIMEWLIWDTYDHLIATRGPQLFNDLSKSQQADPTDCSHYHLSLKKTTRVKVDDEGAILSDPLGFRLEITRPTSGIRRVLGALSSSGGQEEELCEMMTSEEGFLSTAKFYYFLSKLDEGGLLCRSLLDEEEILVTLVPTSKYFRFSEKRVCDNNRYLISRFTCCYEEYGSTVLESIVGHAKLILHSKESIAIAKELSEPRTIEEIARRTRHIDMGIIEDLLSLFLSSEIISEHICEKVDAA